MLSRVLLAPKLRLASFGVAGTLFASAIFPTASAIAAQQDALDANHTDVTSNDIGNALSHTGKLLEDSSTVTTTSDSHSALKAVVGGATVTVPKHAADGVTLSGQDGSQLTVQLPNAAQGSDAAAVANGVVAYAGTNGSANAVQATEHGVRMLTVIDSPSAPTMYDYKVSVPNGGKIELDKTGGAVVRNVKGTVIATIAAPWATDATGKAVKTYFTTDGQTLTQYILHNVPGITYPVTADPWLSWGWNLYVNFTWWETQTIEHYQEAGGFGWALANYVCSKIPYAPAEVTCVVVTLYKTAQLAWAVRNASETNSCLQLAVPYYVLSNPWFYWYVPWFGWARC